MDSAAIQQLIPHRHPFLFLVSAEIGESTSGRGEAAWPSAHPIFEGHFPGMPIVPGVCQIEAAAQLAAVVISHEARRRAADGDDLAQYVGVIAGVRKAHFHSPLFPDETLDLSVKFRSGLGLLGLVSGDGFRGKDRIITFELMVGVVPKSEVSDVLTKFKERAR